MKVYENKLYQEDIKYVAKLNLPWNKLKNCSMMISGASGLIGSCLIDVIMSLNKDYDLKCNIYALGRNIVRAKERFEYCWDNDCFHFISYDINQPLSKLISGMVDYVLHLASNTHPIAYSTEPIDTITTNIIGTKNMLDFAAIHDAKRVLFASSNEIYGENRGDVEFFDEHYCGYINSNTLRAGYPESKRCGEALCQAYKKQKNLDIVIPRLTRSYGPTVLMNDSKAINQFIRNGLKGENIVLKSEGLQYYSYTYVTDAVSGLLTVLLKGESGEAYNIADESGDITLRGLATIIANYSGTKVIFELPDNIEKEGYSTVTKARLDGSKLKALGWSPEYCIYSGVRETMDIMSEV